MGGNQLSPEYTYLQIKLMRCSAGTVLPTSYPLPSIFGRRLQISSLLPNLTKPNLSNLNCGLTSAISSVLTNNNFYFVFVNSYFAPLDYNEPINSFLDDSIFYEMESSKNKKADLMVR